MVEYFSSMNRNIETDQTPVKKQIILAEYIFDLDKINFSEQDNNTLRVSYDRNHLSVYVEKEDANRTGCETNIVNDCQPVLKFPLKIEDLLQFDIGKAYIGFVQDSHVSYFNVDINQWSMKGFNLFDSEDPWNGLTPEYDCKWPASLVISSQVIDKYSNIFRLLFPIKFVQVFFRLISKYSRLNCIQLGLISIFNQGKILMSSCIQS